MVFHTLRKLNKTIMIIIPKYIRGLLDLYKVQKFLPVAFNGKNDDGNYMLIIKQIDT